MDSIELNEKDQLIGELEGRLKIMNQDNEMLRANLKEKSSLELNVKLC